jgi:hypothetical protein
MLIIIFDVIFGYFWTKKLTSKNELEILEFLTGSSILCMGVVKLNPDNTVLILGIIIYVSQNLFTLYLNNKFSYVIKITYEIPSMVKIPKIA